MSKNKYDWPKIKSEYINSTVTLRELSEKYGVRYSWLREKAGREKWSEQRAKQQAHTELLTNNQIAKKEAATVAAAHQRTASKLQNNTNTALDLIDEALQQITILIYRNRDAEPQIIDTGLIDVDKLRKIVSSLKDINEMQREKETDADTLQKLDEVLAQMGGSI